MSMSKIVAMYRIKNEERWIEKSIRSILGICSEIVIFDDGSTDKTLEICRGFKEIVDIQCQSESGFDEVRDKNKLLKMALKRKPDYILAMDGDEILSPNSDKIILEELNVLYSNADIFEFQFLYMWEKPNQYRYDGKYSDMWHKRLMKTENQLKDLSFNESGYAGNLHCGSIPQNAVGMDRSVRSRAKILHYGNYDVSLRNKKYQFYNELDPEDKEQDNYRHIISGEGKFSGSYGMEFMIIPNGLYPEDIK